MAKACAYSCQHRLWWHAGISEFGELSGIIQCSIHCVAFCCAQVCIKIYNNNM